MKIYRPLWSDGAFLAPQQFQQQARWDSYLTSTIANMTIASTWGVICAEFDESALTISRLSAQKLIVCFPDGTLVDTTLADNLPPVNELSHYSQHQTLDIVLALPLLLANGGNLMQEGRSDRATTVLSRVDESTRFNWSRTDGYRRVKAQYYFALCS